MKYLRFFTCLWMMVGLWVFPPQVAAAVVPPPDAKDIQLVGQFGGASYAVALQARYVYLGIGPRLAILDVSDPQHMQLIGQTDVFPGIVNAVVGVGDYVYVAAGTTGMYIVDVDDLTTPQIVGYYAVPNGVSGMVAAGNYLYVTAGDGSLRVINVISPTNPTQAGFVSIAAAQDVAVAGNYAYVVGGSRLTVVNITDPALPVVAGTLTVLQSTLRDVVVVGNLAYLAAGEKGLQMVNVANPAAPVLRGGYDTPGTATGVAVAGSYAYVTDGLQGMRIINVANPDAPTPVGLYDTSDMASAVVVNENIAFVADRYRGLRALDVSTPTAPSEKGAYDIVGDARSLLLNFPYLYVADGDGGLRILNVVDPAHPREIGSYDTPGNAAGVSVAGGYAYVADGVNIRIIDITTPSAPVERGQFPTYNGWAYALVARADYLYIAEGGIARGLHIASLADPISPVTRAFVDGKGNAFDVALAGNRAYVAAEKGGLRVIDITDPPRATTVFTWGTSVDLYHVAVEGKYAYVTGGNYLYGIDVSAASPVRVLTWTTPGTAEGVTVVDNIAYVATRHSGLRLVSVGDPASPNEVAYYNTAGEALSAVVAGQYIYVADGHGGVVILWYSPSTAGTIAAEGGTFTSTFDGVTYTFPKGAFTDTIVLRHIPMSPALVPPLGNLTGINRFFNTTAVYSSTGAPAPLVPGTVFTISVAYTPAERGIVDEATLALYHWNGTAWSTTGITKVTPTQGGTLLSRLDHLSLFGVLGEVHRSYLPLVLRKSK